MTNAPPDTIVKIAVDTANKGPCAKSKRGVVIFEANASGGVVYGNAHNSPPWPFECSRTDACRKDCGRICVHAEQRAILQFLGNDFATRPIGRHVEYQLVHVKTVNGVLVTSPDGPSCDQCSKLVLEVGIQTVWLYVAEGIWAPWAATSFHQRTLRNLGLHDHL